MLCWCRASFRLVGKWLRSAREMRVAPARTRTATIAGHVKRERQAAVIANPAACGRVPAQFFVARFPSNPLPPIESLPCTSIFTHPGRALQLNAFDAELGRRPVRCARVRSRPAAHRLPAALLNSEMASAAPHPWAGCPQRRHDTEGSAWAVQGRVRLGVAVGDSTFAGKLSERWRIRRFLCHGPPPGSLCWPLKYSRGQRYWLQRGPPETSQNVSGRNAATLRSPVGSIEIFSAQPRPDRAVEGVLDGIDGDPYMPAPNHQSPGCGVETRRKLSIPS